MQAFGIDPASKRPCSFAFSSKTAPQGWTAFTFDLPISKPVFYLVAAKDAKLGQIKSLASRIVAENYVLLMDRNGEEGSGDSVLVMRRSRKGDNSPLVVPLRKEEDYERVINAVRKFPDFLSDELTAHSSLNGIVDLLKAGAERYFINRGLFSNHYLKERLGKSLSERGRTPEKESSGLIAKFDGEIPTDPDNARNVLSALGYAPVLLQADGHAQYLLKSASTVLDAVCIVARTASLDTKSGSDMVVPSYQAVASLKEKRWVILTNGRLWRLYSSRVSSASTNYFEVDLEGIVLEDDSRLVYFVSLFSAASLISREGVTDLDITFEGGLKYAKEIEEDLRTKIFEGQLFLDMVRAVL